MFLLLDFIMFLLVRSFIVLLFVVLTAAHNVDPDSDVGQDMVNIVTEKGYIIETHYVTTVDGYILTVFRIPASVESAQTGFQPVILQHGLLDSSYTWINNPADESLGFILADQGFDVWFGNNRGNRYGRNHTTLDPDVDTNAFWSFSWDEMAMIDAPTIIHYVLDTTNHTKVSWIGHSEGTVQMFAAASSIDNGDTFLKTAINSLNLFVALAPVAYVSNIGSKLLQGLAKSEIMEDLIEHGMYEFLPYGPIESIAPELCRRLNLACDLFLMSLVGPTKQMNTSRIQVYVSETPAGTSAKNMMHWIQGIRTPTFQKYDYGTSDDNIAHYGVPSPPQYDLSKLSIPTAIFSGTHDYLADPEDVQKIIDEVHAINIVYNDVQPDYAHMDFVWAPSANTRIYPTVINLLQKYSLDVLQ